jgi:hypothetical protein
MHMGWLLGLFHTSFIGATLPKMTSDNGSLHFTALAQQWPEDWFTQLRHHTVLIHHPLTLPSKPPIPSSPAPHAPSAPPKPCRPKRPDQRSGPGPPPPDWGSLSPHLPHQPSLHVREHGSTYSEICPSGSLDYILDIRNPAFGELHVLHLVSNGTGRIHILSRGGS